ncbi:MAG TPA: hypothetical protein VKU81_02960, partial [Casimicrobiaceae bacterium]|nr:hypothetical protein [Casimicrobiaceae bacterium]
MIEKFVPGCYAKAQASQVHGYNRRIVTLRSPAALFAISTLIWGSTWLAIKFQLDGVAPEVSVAYRFV